MFIEHILYSSYLASIRNSKVNNPGMLSNVIDFTYRNVHIGRELCLRSELLPHFEISQKKKMCIAF